MPAINPSTGKGRQAVEKKNLHLSSKEKSRILTLSSSGMSANTVAKQLKRNRRTVAKFLDEPGTKEVLADMYERLCRQILESVCPEDISKATLLQKTTSAAIATDKMQLLRDKPTQNIGYLLEAVLTIREMRKFPVPPQLPNATGVTLSIVEANENSDSARS